MARARAHYVSEALLAPLSEAAAGGEGTDMCLAAAACTALADTFTEAVERLSRSGGLAAATAAGSTQLSEGWAEPDGTQLGAGPEPVGVRVGGGGGDGGERGGVSAVAQRCLREVSGSLDEVVGLEAIKQAS